MACLAGGLLWLVINAAQAISLPLGGPVLGLVGTLTLVGLMGGPLGLLVLRAAGNGLMGWVGKVGAAIVLAGLLWYPAGEVLQPALGLSTGEMGIFYAAGVLLVGLGMMSLGIAAISARRMAGWKRFAPLSVAAYYVAMIPIQVVFFIGPNGAPSGTLLALWGLTWALLGYAIVSEAGRKGVIGAYVNA
jgi:hypothetical protein